MQLPSNSLFLSGDPWYLILLPFLVAALTANIVLHLALYSINIKVPGKRGVLPAAVLGLTTCLARQLLPPPFHVIVSIILLVFLVKYLGDTSFKRAIISAIFFTSACTVGVITTGPLLMLSRQNPETLARLLGGSLWNTIGISIESVFPAVILYILIRYRKNPVVRTGRADRSAARDA